MHASTQKNRSSGFASFFFFKVLLADYIPKDVLLPLLGGVKTEIILKKNEKIDLKNIYIFVVKCTQILTQALGPERGKHLQTVFPAIFESWNPRTFYPLSQWFLFFCNVQFITCTIKRKKETTFYMTGVSGSLNWLTATDCWASTAIASSSLLTSSTIFTASA